MNEETLTSTIPFILSVLSVSSVTLRSAALEGSLLKMSITQWKLGRVSGCFLSPAILQREYFMCHHLSPRKESKSTSDVCFLVREVSPPPPAAEALLSLQLIGALIRKFWAFHF